MKEAVFFQESVIVITREQIEELKLTAREAPLRRARLCLHSAHADQVQEMIIALCRDTHVRPHRHPGRSESFHVMEGSVRVQLFNDFGDVTRNIDLADNGALPSVYRMNEPFWHTTIPLSDIVIIHETVTGPFDKYSSEFPLWERELIIH